MACFLNSGFAIKLRKSRYADVKVELSQRCRENFSVGSGQCITSQFRACAHTTCFAGVVQVVQNSTWPRDFRTVHHLYEQRDLRIS